MSLSNAVLNAQTSAGEAASRIRPYFAAKRDLEELVRFQQILQTKIAMERTDLQLPENLVEIVEEAVAPTQAVAANRARALTLLAAGLVLALVGWFLARTSRPGIMMAKIA
jgi:hypothetical protein